MIIKFQNYIVSHNLVNSNFDFPSQFSTKSLLNYETSDKSRKEKKTSNLEVAKRVADFLESRNLKGLQALLADDFRAKGGTLELPKQQALGYLQIFFTAFPDHSFGFADFDEKGDLVYCTGQETGTHKGVLDLNPLGMPVSLPPTGKSFNLPKSLFTFRVVADKVTYLSEEAVTGGGLAGILEQLGVKLP